VRAVILEIRAAMGGDDAAHFADELLRAELRYAERSGWTSEILERTDDGAGQIRSAVVRISGQGIAALEAEIGTHRVTRIPTNERNGRRHTSAVTVAVLPIPDQLETVLAAAEVRIEAFRATGPGGQHRNKTETAIRAIHLPTGLMAVIANERSRESNRRLALEVLTARVVNARTQAAAISRETERAGMHGRGHIAERQRSYLWREGVAVDHRTGVRVPLSRALDGELAPFAAG
jgi:peptide chain release factor 1